MKSKSFQIMLLVVVLGLILSACNGINLGAKTPVPTEVPVVVAESAVTAEGKLVPLQYVDLALKTGGQVAEILVKEGEQAQAGQVIARLENAEQLQSAVAAAELEQLNAQQALKTLDDNANVGSASAAQAVADARDGVRAAQRYLDNLKADSEGTDIQKAQANLIILKDKLTQAKKDYAPWENKSEDSLKRANLLSKMADAQEKYDDAERFLNNLEGNASELDMTIAEANLSLAQAQLALNEQNYEDVKTGPNPDQLAAAQARLKAADARLTAGKSALNDIELVAPFSGTVVNSKLKVGEQAAPGQPVVTLADLSQWMVETDDLTEISVPSIYVGQAVTVVPDALPDLKLKGKVNSISNLFEEKRGDVTYTAKILLDNTDERLRWGMTVANTFEK